MRQTDVAIIVIALILAITLTMGYVLVTTPCMV
jgi:hypothetical protein